MADKQAGPTRCRHCRDPIVIANPQGQWAHREPSGTLLFSCQHTVKYGTAVAEPIVIDAETARTILDADRAAWAREKGS